MNDSEQHTPREAAARKLACLIGHLCETLGSLTEPSCLQSQGFMTREDLEAMEGRILMAVSKQVQDLTDNFKAQLARINAVLDRQQSALSGVTQDHETMKGIVEQLQASQGPWNAEDQTALDELQATLVSAADRAEAVTKGFEDVDALVAPPVNPNPGNPPVQ